MTIINIIVRLLDYKISYYIYYLFLYKLDALQGSFSGLNLIQQQRFGIFLLVSPVNISFKPFPF